MNEKDKITRANGQINKIISAIQQEGYPNSIVFCAREIKKDESALLDADSKAKADKIVDGTSFMDGDGAMLHACVTSLFATNNSVYSFFSSALEAAREMRNRNNPNVN